MLKKRKRRGFTLVELIVVVAILAILAALALPRYNESRKKARETANETNIRILESAALTYLADNGNPDTEITWSETGGGHEEYVSKWPKSQKEDKTEYTVVIKTDGTVEVK